MSRVTRGSAFCRCEKVNAHGLIISAFVVGRLDGFASDLRVGNLDDRLSRDEAYISFSYVR